MGRIISFKDALGLGPEDAAAAHMDVGRRFQRLANEAAGRGDKAEYKKVRAARVVGLADSCASCGTIRVALQTRAWLGPLGGAA